jgi:hypothetical protein
LKRNNTEFDINYFDEIKDIIEREDIPYHVKKEMLELLNNIDNTLFIYNQINEDYENDSILAKDELLYDKSIEDEYKPTLKYIVEDYIKNFYKNLTINTKTFYGYDYNIITYSLFGQNVRKFFNKIFYKILGLLSVWLLFTKPIFSPVLIAKYILLDNEHFKHLLVELSGKTTLWKYATMGLDNSYFEHKIKQMNNNIGNSIFKKKINILYFILLLIILLPLFYFYNTTTFGLTITPSWYNGLYQVIFILNIIGNIYCYFYKKSIALYNIIFLIVFIVIFLIVYLIIYLISKNK